MNHLYSRLENATQDRTENDPPILHQSAESPAETTAQSAAGIPTEPSPATAASPLIRDYAISSRVGPASEPPAHAFATLPAAWPVKLWFFSLLSLIALALLTLALPAQHDLLSWRRPDSRPGAGPQAAALPPSTTRATPPAAPVGVAPGARPTQAAPALAIQREPRPAKPAPSVHTVPLPEHAQRNTANCSEAMLAMNLCTTPSP
jgi:hypothetical protein